MRFLHGMIRVKDIKKSLEFYCDFLGLKVGKTNELEDYTLYFLEDDKGNRALELTANNEVPKEGYELGNCFGHFAFAVSDFKEIEKKLPEFGLKWLYEPFILKRKDSTKQTKIAFLKDPEGIEIELIEKE